MVFAQDLDRTKYPPLTRARGIVVGSVLMLAIFTALFGARTLAVSFVLFAGGLILARLLAGEASWTPNLRAQSTLAAFALTLLAGISAIWAEEPKAAFIVFVSAAAWLLLIVYSVANLRDEHQRNVFHMAEGLWLGLLAGLVYLLIELISDQAIKLFIINHLHIPRSWLQPEKNYRWAGDVLVAISSADMTRNLTPVPLLVWSAIIALRTTSPWRARLFWQGLIFAVTVAAVMSAGNETAKVALVVSSLVFILAMRHASQVLTTLQIAWVATCLFVVPLGLGLYRAELHTAPWLQRSAQHRVVIWNHVAEQVMNRPILGIGTGMTAHALAATAKPQKGKQEFSTNAGHAHNIFLQTWYELGVVGAIILSLFGLGLLDAIKHLKPRHQPAALAVFAASFATASTSFGLWQSWFMSMFGLTLLSFVLAVKADPGHEAPPDRQ